MPISLRIIEPAQLGKGYKCVHLAPRSTSPSPAPSLSSQQSSITTATTDNNNVDYTKDNISTSTTVAVSSLIVSQSVANSILSKALLQLSSLLKHADGIFTNLSDECRKVYDRTNQLNARILTLTECVDKLNHKTEIIACVDLKKFHKDSPPFDAKHGYECNMFTVETRPCSVKDLYSMADISPSEGLCALDGIRKDGWSGSTMFKLWPVINQDINISTPDFNSSRKWYSYENVRCVRKRRPPLPIQNPPVQFQKTYKTLKVPQRSQLANSFDHLNMMEDADTDDMSDLSKSQPSILVSIDTSGASFERMCSYRRSLRDSVSEKSLTCTRRRSISGLPESIMNEIKNFEARKRNSCRFSSVPRRYPRTYSFNDLDPVHSKDEAFAKYFEEIEGKLDERNEWDNIMKQSFLSKIISCSRSHSVPHNQKPKYTKLIRSNSYNRKSIVSEDFDMRSLTRSNSDYVKQCRRKSSFIGDRIKNFIKIGSKPERKSVDLGLLKIPQSYHDSLDDSKLALVKTVSMPDRICETTPEPVKPVEEEDDGSCHFYNFSNNTLPRAQAKKYDFPWESLPKDWTTSVRMREISKRRKEERQSSSGNWSGTSSVRQSIESDQTSMTVATDRVVSSTASFCSLGQDSGRDSATEMEDRRFSDAADCGGDEMSTLTGEASDRDSLNTELFKLDALVHRRNLMARTFNPDNTSSSSLESGYSKMDIFQYDPESVLSYRQFKQQDDEVSSLYSLDEDGFYTSFHSDSGLKAMRKMSKSRMSELSEIYSKFIVRPKYQNASSRSSSTIENYSLTENIYDKELEAEMREERDQTPTREMNLPCRISSPTESETSDSTLTNTSNRNSLVTGASESNYSESDHEIIYKHIKDMTAFSPKSFPSWCIISSSGSDEDSTNQLHASQKSEIDSSSSGYSLAVGVSPTTSDAKDSDDGGNTLPRNYLASEKWEANADKTGSWPRSHTTSSQGKKQQGILKSSFRKDSESKAKLQKSLNFSPYVNLLPAGEFQTQQCLLSDISAMNKPHYSTLPVHNSFTSTLSSTSSSSATICNDDVSTLNSMSDCEDDVLPPYPQPSSTELASFSTGKEPCCNSYQNRPETLALSQTSNLSEPLTYPIIIRKPQPQFSSSSSSSNFMSSCSSNTSNNNININTNINSQNILPGGVNPYDSTKPHTPPSATDLSPPSSPYAVSFIPNSFTGLPSSSTPSSLSTPSSSSSSSSFNNNNNISISKNSMSFTVNKPIVSKTLPFSETVAINPANNGNNNNSNNLNAPAGTDNHKRLSLTTFTIPSTNQEPEQRTSPSSPNGGKIGDASKRLNFDPSVNRSGSFSDDSQPESCDSNCKYNSRNGSYRVAMYEESVEEPKRLDSYRMAINASNKITDDLINRNSSYRVAVQDRNLNHNNNNSNNNNNLAEPTNRSDSYRVAMTIETSDRCCKSFNKDVRRQGITDINQLKIDESQQFDSFVSSIQKSSSLRTKMSSVFGSSSTKSDSHLLTNTKSQNSKKKYPKGSSYITDSPSSTLTLKNSTKRQSLPNQRNDLHSLKKLVAQQTPTASPKASAVEVLKRKPSAPYMKDISSESSNKGILGGLFQRPSSWGGTSKVNPKMSTYVSFDTIFEDKEALSNASSIESLRSPSLTSIKKIGDPNNLHTVKFNHGLKADRKSLIEVNKHLSEEEQRNRKKRLGGTVDEKAVQSVLDSIKSTIRSMTSRSDSSYKQQSSAT
ncbi:uncharacterized protein LOC115219682 [Argonauta hians]